MGKLTPSQIKGNVGSNSKKPAANSNEKIESVKTNVVKSKKKKTPSGIFDGDRI